MLLLKDNAGAVRHPPERLIVTPGTCRAISVAKGQILRITAKTAGAVASLYGFSQLNPEIFLSVHHTRVFSNSYLLNLGMRLVTNRRRTLMVMGKDSSGTHDLLLPASTTGYLAAHGYSGEMGCVEAVSKLVGELGLMPPKLPDPVNLFMHVKLHQDGRLEPLTNKTREGDFVACRVVLDTTFIVSACCTGIPGNDRPGALEIACAEELDEL